MMRRKLLTLAALLCATAAQAAPLSPQDYTDIQLLYANAAYKMDAGTWTRHIITDLLLTPTAKGAEGVAYVLVIKDAHPQPQNRIKGISAMSRDELAKDASGWHFVTRNLWDDQDPATPYRNRNCKNGMNNCHMGKP